MKHEIDLSKYQIRTDLIIEDLNNLKNSETKNKKFKDIKITNVILNEADSKIIDKKKGNYITIEFSDVTDEENEKNVVEAFKIGLKELLKETQINENDSCLVIGLGNKNSTPDSLGPLSIKNILVTRHLFLLNEVDNEYRMVSAYAPGVTGVSGIETSDIIKALTEKTKPKFIIVIDALASNSIERVNKTIQMSNTGIHPGSGVGNSRKEISKETLGIPVISIGIPTVVDAVAVVSDTINYMHKHYAFSKKFIDSPMNRLVSLDKINYLKQELEIKEEDKKKLLGLVGNLNQNEVRQLIFEVLTPIGYNLMVTPKEIDFVIEKLSDVISKGINQVLQKKLSKDS